MSKTNNQKGCGGCLLNLVYIIGAIILLVSAFLATLAIPVIGWILAIIELPIDLALLGFLIYFLYSESADGLKEIFRQKK